MKPSKFKKITWYHTVQFSSVQFLSHVWLFATPWTAARQASLSITNSQSLLKLMSIESVMPSNHLILCCPFLLLLQSFPASGSFPMSWFLCVWWPKYWSFSFSISQFSHSVMSDSLRPYGLQHTRPPCPSSTPWPWSNLCPSSQWCHPTISSSVISFSSHLQSFPASRSFPKSQFFDSGGQSIGASALASVLPMNIQDWSTLRWTGWISLQFKGLSRVFSNTTVQKHQFFNRKLSLWSKLTSIHDYWKSHSFDYMALCW